jgi:hypothetical protein
VVLDTLEHEQAAAAQLEVGMPPHIAEGVDTRFRHVETEELCLGCRVVLDISKAGRMQQVVSWLEGGQASVFLQEEGKLLFRDIGICAHAGILTLSDGWT